MLLLMLQSGQFQQHAWVLNGKNASRRIYELVSHAARSYKD